MTRQAASSFVARIERGKLTPVTGYDAEILSQYAEGTELVCRVSTPKGRSKLLSKYFAVLDRLIEGTYASDKWPTKDALSRHLLTRLGHVRHFETTGNMVIMEPISPSEMPAKDFENFYTEAMALIPVEVVPGIDMHALTEERRIAYLEEDDSL